MTKFLDTDKYPNVIHKRKNYMRKLSIKSNLEYEKHLYYESIFVNKEYSINRY